MFIPESKVLSLILLLLTKFERTVCVTLPVGLLD